MPIGDRGAVLSLLLAVSVVSVGSGQTGDRGAVDLDNLGNPVQLEPRLRGLLVSLPPGATTVTAKQLGIINGQARVGNFRLATGERLTGNLLVLRGNAELSGRLSGNIVVLDGDLVLHEGALVGGDALVIGGHIRERGGAVQGEQRSLDAAQTPSARPGFAGQALTRLAGLAGVLITLTLLGFGMVVFAHPQLETVSDTVANSITRSFLTGLVAQVVVLPTLGILVTGLVLSVVGILLVPFVLIVLPLLLIAAIVGGLLAVLHAMGETRLRRRMAAGARVGSANSYRYLLLGLSTLAAMWLAWILFGWVPVAGALVFGACFIATWLLATIGFGAALLSRGGIRPAFAGRYVPPEAVTDEYLWATPQFGVTAAKRPPTGKLPRDQ
jgi:hypothetical protein